MGSIFYESKSLSSLDLSNWDTTNVADFSSMFFNCSSLTSLDLSSFNTTNAIYSDYMFSGVQKNAEVYYDSIIWTLPTSGKDFDVTFIDIRNRYTFDLSLTNNLSIALVDENNIGESNRITKWGDGTIDNNLSHTYTTVGTYTVSTNLQLGQESNVQIAQLDFVNIPSLNENEYDDETGRKIKNYGERSNKNYLPSDITLLSDIETFAISSDTEDSYGNSLSIKDVNTATCLTEAYVGTTSKCAYMFNKCPNLLKVDLTNFKLADDDINMEKMFFRCYALKEIIGIEDLNVSNVENMYDLFAFMGYRYHEYDDDWNLIVSYKFTLDLSKWDISNVKRLDCLVSMCYGLTDLNISTWDTSNVINYAYMFESCYSLTNLQGALNITNKAIYLDGLFSGCRLLSELDVSNWDVSNCTNLSYLFEGCKNLEVIDVSNWVLNEKLEDITSLFEDCNKVKVLDVSNWIIGSTVKYMYGVFKDCNELTKLNISNWRPKPTTLGYCFSGCNKITSLDVSNFDITNLTNIAGTFSWLTSLTELDLSTWNTTKINFVAYCFAGLLLEEIRVPNIKTLQLSNVNSIFCDCINLKVADISGFSCKKITDNTYKYRTFYDVPSDVLVYIDHSKWLLNETELSVPDNMFVEKDKNVFKLTTTNSENILELTNIYSPSDLTPLTNWGDGTTNAELTHTYSTAGNYKVVTNLQFARITDTANDNYNMVKTPLATRMYAAAPANSYDHLFAKLDRVTLMDVRDFKICIDDASCWCLFYMMSSLERFIGLENLNTTKIKSFNSLFNGCINITDLHAVENWDVSNIYNMGHMFKECSSITSLDLSNWDVSAVTEGFWNMFNSCTKLVELNLSGWDVSKAKYNENMFSKCSNLETLNLSGWIGFSPIEIYGMFDSCFKLTEIDVKNWNLKNVENLNYMFYNCTSLTSLDLSTWNTSNIILMNSLFSGCTSLTSLDLSNFDTSKVTDMDNMFNNVSELSQLHMDYCSSNTVTAVLNVINDRSSKTSGTLYVTDSVYTSVKSLANSKNWYSSPEMESGDSND